MAPLILTPRFELRELASDDLDFVAALLADPDVMRFAPAPFTRPQAAEWLARQRRRYTSDGYGLWLTVSRDSQQPVGTIGLLDQWVADRREREVAFIVHRPFWGQGVATEVATGVRDHAWRTWPDESLIALVRPDNPAAQAVVHKLGFQPDGITEHDRMPHVVFRGRPIPARDPAGRSGQ